MIEGTLRRELLIEDAATTPPTPDDPDFLEAIEDVSREIDGKRPLRARLADKWWTVRLLIELIYRKVGGR